ncbi:phytanoyl-CoA dioxygenase [Aureococcus anophagefferens]|nr:phytanoyl-CoA dioxygenase [Aureococcus anophagefferens]
MMAASIAMAARALIFAVAVAGNLLERPSSPFHDVSATWQSLDAALARTGPLSAGDVERYFVDGFLKVEGVLDGAMLAELRGDVDAKQTEFARSLLAEGRLNGTIDAWAAIRGTKLLRMQDAAGDVIFFGPTMVHRSIKNSGSTIRWSADLRWHQVGGPGAPPPPERAGGDELDFFYGLKNSLVIAEPGAVAPGSPAMDAWASIDRSEVQEAGLNTKPPSTSTPLSRGHGWTSEHHAPQPPRGPRVASSRRRSAPPSTAPTDL